MAGGPREAVGNGLVGDVLLDAGVDTLGLEGLFEVRDAVLNLIVGVVELLEGDGVVLLSLLVVEFKLLAFAVLFPLLVLLPVFDSLRVPLLHEASVALQLVDLDASHLLLALGLHVLLPVGMGLGIGCLTLLFVFKFADVGLHIEGLLGLVEGVDAGLEEGVLDPVVGLFGARDLLSWLVVSKLAGLAEDGDICWWVDLLKHHLELVEQPEGVSTLFLHDLVDHLRVTLDLQVPQGGIQLLEVLQLV